MIDRYQLRYFLAVVETGNFSRAAAKMNVTQPTLSVGIAKLEKGLGATLFLRNSQRVHLTEAGVQVLNHARAIEREFHALDAGVGGARQRRRLRLGVLSTLATGALEALCLKHRQAYGDDELDIIEGSERDLSSALQRQRIDIAISVTRINQGRYRQLPLFAEGYVLAVPEFHTIAGLESIDGASLANEVMIVRRHCEALAETSRYFTERGVRPAFSFRTLNDEKALAMVRAGLGITVTPQSLVAPGVKPVKLQGFDLQRHVGLVFDDASEAMVLERAKLWDAIAGAL
jgi:LysR family hydrogen peroxide-inducible transcriptional activator